MSHELFLRSRPFGIVESSYYKDQWLGYDRYLCSQVSDVKSLALHVTSINLVSLERESIVEYVFPCFQLGKLDLSVT